MTVMFFLLFLQQMFLFERERYVHYILIVVIVLQVYNIKTIRLYNWNMGSSLYVNYTSINLLKCLLDASSVPGQYLILERQR